MLGARLIKSGRLDRVIVGGADSLAKYTVNGFNSLMILSEKPCKPFDIDRDGLTLGEGAGYLVLEGANTCKNKLKLAEVLGYGMPTTHTTPLPHQMKHMAPAWLWKGL